MWGHRIEWAGIGVVMVSGLLLSSGCSSGSSPGGGTPSTKPSRAAASPSETSLAGLARPAPVTSSAVQQPITLAFGGDVHFADQVAALLKSPQSSLTSLRPYLGSADLTMVNLETALTSRGVPAPKAYRFRATPAALSALSASGVDVVTMANNHAVDYGATGLSDTLAAQRASSMPIVGIGSNAERAYAPALFTVRGTRIAVLAASQISDWTLRNWTATSSKPGIASSVPITRLAAAVRKVSGQADLVLVYLHWGTEGQTCPDRAQQETAKALAAAGADVVLGSHAHRVQGAGWMGDTYVGYGLGNFVWYNSSSGGSSTSGVLTLTVRGRRVVSQAWTPMVISRSGVPKVPVSVARARMLSSWKQARGCTGLASVAS